MWQLPGGIQGALAELGRTCGGALEINIMGTNCTVVFCHLTGAYISNIMFSSSRMSRCPLSCILTNNLDRLEKVSNKYILIRELLLLNLVSQRFLRDRCIVSRSWIMLIRALTHMLLKMMFQHCGDPMLPLSFVLSEFWIRML